MAASITIRGNSSGPGSTQINNVNYSTSHSNDDIDRACLRALRCPDALAVKTRLKENKDKLLHKSFEWILTNPDYVGWRDGHDVCLLWIRGGAGKGKTMMSIGLVEELAQQPKDTTVVTYFFCQNADYELNTVESIIKGLILQLVNQQDHLKTSLRDRWNTVRQCFDRDVSSWRQLWDIFIEMLDRCVCSRVYVLIDALDECREDGMANFLHIVCRTGLGKPSQIKWLLTSRQFDSAERELLNGSEQLLVSLELNSEHISHGVKAYITHKVTELDRRHKYRTTLRQEIQLELEAKAEDTFLWVSLVCKRLESVRREDALSTIQSLPPGLYPFYDRIMHQINDGEPEDVHGCMRLLKSMILAYRPLNMLEVVSVSALPEEEGVIEDLVNRCASFVKLRGSDIEFVHQSARDYLVSGPGRSMLDAQGAYNHGDVALNCLSYLSRHLKRNLIGLPRPDSTREQVSMLDVENRRVLTTLDYVTTFWARHLSKGRDSAAFEEALMNDGLVDRFFHNNFLEWLEYFSLRDRLAQASVALRMLHDLAVDIPQQSSFLPFVQDAIRFLQRHSATFSTWPLQIYSSGIAFSPEISFVRRANIHKRPGWLVDFPKVQQRWGALVQNLPASNSVVSVSISAQGWEIASGFVDGTIKIWDATTGKVECTLKSDSGSVYAIAFSPDGRRVVSGYKDGSIKVWDVATGKIERILNGHSNDVYAVAFLPDGRQIVSLADEGTITMWDTITAEVLHKFDSKSSRIYSLATSPEGTWIASGCKDGTIEVWDVAKRGVNRTLTPNSVMVQASTYSAGRRLMASASQDSGIITVWNMTTGQSERMLHGHLNSVCAVAFSSDGRWLASGSEDKTIRLWDMTTGQSERTLHGHLNSVCAAAFSSDGRWLASGSEDKTIKLWDMTTGQSERTLHGHLNSVCAVTFSPDGRWIASGSEDKTIKLWDVEMGRSEKTLTGHCSSVSAVSFSTDGKWIASGSQDGTVKIWNVTKRELEWNLPGPSIEVQAVAFHPNEMCIVSGFADRTIQVRSIPSRVVKNIITGYSSIVYAVARSAESLQGPVESELRAWQHATRDIERLEGHSSFVCTMAFSANGSRLVSGSGDKTVKVWDVIKGELRNTFTGHSGVVYAVAISSDGRQIVSGSLDGTIKVWDEDMVFVRTLTADSRVGHAAVALAKGHTSSSPLECVYAAAISSDGRKLVSRSQDGSIKLWDVTLDEAKSTSLSHSASVQDVAISPNGNWIASGSKDKTIKIWNTKSGEIVRTLCGHSDCVHIVTFSPDGRRIASGSWDTSIGVWDTITGKRERRLIGSTSITYAIAFSPSGERIATGTWSTIRVWNATTGLLEKFISGDHDFGTVRNLRFSTCGQHILSNLGSFCIGPVEEGLNVEEGLHGEDVEPSRSLEVRGQWVQFDDISILRLPSDLQAACCDSRRGQLAIGLTDGRVMSFTIDTSICVDYFP